VGNKHGSDEGQGDEDEDNNFTQKYFFVFNTKMNHIFLGLCHSVRGGSRYQSEFKIRGILEISKIPK